MVVFVAGILIRIVLLPTPGLRGDLDQFVLWVHGIADDGFGHAYDQNLSFPPMMACVWGVLAFIEPAFKTVADASDPWIRDPDEAARVAGRPRDRRLSWSTRSATGRSGR